MSSNKQLVISFIAICGISTLQITNVDSVNAELYTSVEELSNWPNTGRLFYDGVNQYIKAQENILDRLYRLQGKLTELEKEGKLFYTTPDNLKGTSKLRELAHPVRAFVYLNRILKSLNKIYSLFDDDDSDNLEVEDQIKPRDSIMPFNYKTLFEHISLQHNLPTDEDLIGCGEALLRLKAFYELDVDDIVEGKLIGDHRQLGNITPIVEGDNKTLMMQAEDCFKLGKVAYESEQYTESIRWFQKALELKQGNDELSKPNSIQNPIISLHEDINEILEYMAFAAYKSGQIKYSAQLTKLWLERDPDNDRAKGNLEYYEEELMTECSGDLETNEIQNGTIYSNENSRLNLSNVYYSNANFNPSEYVVEEDKIVRDLCRAKVDNMLDKSHRCLREETLAKNYMNSPEAKIEIINSEPYIIRIHDIISDQEAEHLRRLAFPKLSRSTIQTKTGLTTSDFRIAKTAWLSHKSDPIVFNIERRLSNLLGLNFHESEEIQVVNYGLGGFYGPHLDSARESSIDNYNSVPISNLINNDRLATILLYLNDVEAGGSTVFPRLNITVLPIKRSAVFWFNIRKNGFSDERTLHIGCPILLGSKWIATKWPRELANSFIRPCGLKHVD